MTKIGLRILVYGINYYPELTGIGKYTSEMCEWLSKNDQSVTVVTSNPYYPDWKIHAGFRNRFSKENLNGVHVLRCPLYVPGRVTGMTRILHEISFVISSYIRLSIILFKPKFDIVICIAPPFHSGFFGQFYRLIKGAKYVYHVQDLQVDAAKKLGLIKSNFLLNFFHQLEKTIMLKSDLLSTISKGMALKIEERVRQKPINITSNWVDTEFIKPGTRLTTTRKSFGYSENDIIILYSGNLGEKQGLEIIIETAKQLIDHPHLKFLICGNGAYREKMIDLTRSFGLVNIKFDELQPYEKLPELLNTADIHLVIQKRATADLVMPSKLTGIAASGGYSIVTADQGTSLYNEVVNNRIGTVIAPEDPNKLAEAIINALSLDLKGFRLNARKYAEQHLNKDVILQSFLDKLITLNGKEGTNHRDNRSGRSIPQ